MLGIKRIFIIRAKQVAGGLLALLCATALVSTSLWGSSPFIFFGERLASAAVLYAHAGKIGFTYSSAKDFSVIQSSDGSGSADIVENTTTNQAIFNTGGIYDLKDSAAWDGSHASAHTIRIAAAAGSVTLGIIGDVSLQPPLDTHLPGIDIAPGANLTLDIASAKTLTALGAQEDKDGRSQPGIKELAGSVLTIKGAGKLVATGGANTSQASYYAAGAGIGGAGQSPSTDLGTVNIAGSVSVYATGGADGAPGSGVGNRGAGSGAGIGSGGYSSGFAGTVNVSEQANLVATGGFSLLHSGAGIGLGGYSSYKKAGPHCVEVNIDTSGYVIAQGGAAQQAAGAGIGTGGQQDSEAMNAPQLTIDQGTLIAIGGAGTVGAPAGIGCAAQGSRAAAANLEVAINGGTVIAQAGACKGDANGIAHGIGSYYDGSSTSAVGLTNSSLTIDDGNVYAVNPDNSSVGSVFMQPQDSSGSTLYPVYVADQLPYDTTNTLASTDGVTFQAGDYSATAHDYIHTGSFAYVDATGAPATLGFSGLPQVSPQVSGPVNAVMWLTSPGGSASSAATQVLSAGGGNGKFDHTVGLTANVYAINAPSDASARPPSSSSKNYVYNQQPYMPTGHDSEGFNISPSTGVSGFDYTNVLELEPSVDTTYTISTDYSWDGTYDAYGMLNQLPDHSISIKPTTNGVTVTLIVVGDIYCQTNPFQGTVSCAIYVDPGTTLNLKIKSGVTCKTIASQDPSIFGANGSSGLGVPDGVVLNVSGAGTLVAKGSNGSAAIGGIAEARCGTINVSGCTVVAAYDQGGSYYGAPVGGSQQQGSATPDTSGTLNISGGSVLTYTNAPAAAGLYQVAVSKLAITGGSLLCLSQASGSAPLIDVGGSAGQPLDARGRPLYPTYVPSALGSTGRIRVPAASSASGLTSAAALLDADYQSPLIDSAAVMTAALGTSNFSADVQSALSGVSACMWLPGDTQAHNYARYMDIDFNPGAPVSELLANVDSRLLPYSSTASSLQTALSNDTNLVQASMLTLSGGTAHLALDIGPAQLGTGIPVRRSSTMTLTSNLPEYHVAIQVMGSTADLTSADGSVLPALGADGALVDNTWAYKLVKEGSASYAAGPTNDWWAPTTTASVNELPYQAQALGTQASPAQKIRLWAGAQVDGSQDSGSYGGTVVITASAGL